MHKFALLFCVLSAMFLLGGCGKPSQEDYQKVLDEVNAAYGVSLSFDDLAAPTNGMSLEEYGEWAVALAQDRLEADATLEELGLSPEDIWWMDSDPDRTPPPEGATIRLE